MRKLQRWLMWRRWRWHRRSLKWPTC